MAKIKILYDRNACVAAGNCAQIDPNHFKISNKDGKADLVGGKKEGPLFSLDTEADDKIVAAAHSCPTSAIKVLDEKGNPLA